MRIGAQADIVQKHQILDLADVNCPGAGILKGFQPFLDRFAHAQVAREVIERPPWQNPHHRTGARQGTRDRRLRAVPARCHDDIETVGHRLPGQMDQPVAPVGFPQGKFGHLVLQRRADRFCLVVLLARSTVADHAQPARGKIDLVGCIAHLPLR